MTDTFFERLINFSYKLKKRKTWYKHKTHNN